MTTTKPYEIKNGVLVSAKGNRATITRWATEEEAAKILLVMDYSGCSRCSDCSGCSRCSDCSRCSRCSDCSRCSGCSGCSRCSDLENAAPVAQPASTMEVPTIENIHQSVYEAVTRTGCSLDMGRWHTCETTHCRAGWIVTLAGEAGRKLEAKTSTLFAAQQIYKASGYPISPCRFFDSDSAAMADMKRLAEGGAA